MELLNSCYRTIVLVFVFYVRSWNWFIDLAEIWKMMWSLICS